MTGPEMAQFIDHTLLKPEADRAAMDKLCEEAISFGFKAACVNFVKTSTGFSTSGATPEDVILMRKTVGPKMGVKASGGIKDFKTAAAMIVAGASRIGAGTGVAIVNGAEKLP